MKKGMKYFWLELENTPSDEETNTFIVRASNLGTAKKIVSDIFDDHSCKFVEIKVDAPYFRLVLESLRYINDVANIVEK